VSAEPFTTAPANGDAAAPPPWSCGLLAVDKPTGITSHDVVERVRRRLHQKSAGHLGTLDPGASGLLLIAIGPATRCAPVWQGGEKTYEGVVRFGLVTSTQDLHGEVLERRDVQPDEAAIRAMTSVFVGEIEQIPPMASAVHVGGERLYRMHRRGETVDRMPRRVTVHSWEWMEFAPPDARFRVRCSGGTYVRTLAHDLGERVGAGGTLASLRRLASAPFSIERSVPLSEVLNGPPEASWAKAGYTLEQALAHLPSLRLDDSESEAVGFGRRPVIDEARARALPLGGGPRSVVLLDASGRALALGELEPGEGESRRVCPHVLFPWAVRDGRAADGPPAL
jgi:tRNA pseudouridine55 synthase